MFIPEALLRQLPVLDCWYSGEGLAKAPRSREGSGEVRALLGVALCPRVLGGFDGVGGSNWEALLLSLVPCLVSPSPWGQDWSSGLSVTHLAPEDCSGGRTRGVASWQSGALGEGYGESSGLQSDPGVCRGEGLSLLSSAPNSARGDPTPFPTRGAENSLSFLSKTDLRKMSEVSGW